VTATHHNQTNAHAWFERPDPTGRTTTGERGLRFSCTLCGNCCTGAPGFVRFTDAEGQRIADRLGLSFAQFLDRYTHMTPAGRSLTERETEFGQDCVFLDRETVPGKAVCGVYEDRPGQCKTWPFWPDNTARRNEWERAARGCPGMNKGTLYSPEHIRLTVERQLAEDRTA
jgi:uncharacterized protein